MTSIADCPASPGPAPRPVKALESVPKTTPPDEPPPGTCAWRFDAPLRYWYLMLLCCCFEPPRTRRSARMQRIGDPSIFASTPPNRGTLTSSRVLTTVAGNAAVRSWSRGRAAVRWMRDAHPKVREIWRDGGMEGWGDGGNHRGQ